MSERKCPLGGVRMVADTQRGWWTCPVGICTHASLRCPMAPEAHREPMTAAEQMEALGQEKLL